MQLSVDQVGGDNRPELTLFRLTGLRPGSELKGAAKDSSASAGVSTPQEDDHPETALGQQRPFHASDQTPAQKMIHAVGAGPLYYLGHLEAALG